MLKYNVEEFKKLPIKDFSNIVFSNFYSDSKKKIIHKSILEKAAYSSEMSKLISESYNFINEYTDGIGGCPEFDYLDYHEMQEGYSTTLFIDLVNFTARSLHADGDIEDLKKLVDLKKKFINSCIFVVAVFGGHVHDISGDGIMAFFHRGEKHEQVNNALLAGMLMMFAVKEYLNPELKAEDPNHKDIRVRVGVDTGKVIWTKMGNIRHIESCETKAVGFSVDMAAKLSGGNLSWQLKIGENLYDMGKEEFKELATERYSDYKRTIDGNSIVYKRYIFDWEKYISRFDNPDDFINSELPILGFPETIEQEIIPTSIKKLTDSENKEKIFG